MDRRSRIALVLLGVIIVIAAPTVAESFLSGFGSAQGQIHYQTDTGLEVVTTKDYQIRSGNPFTSESMNLSTESNGWVNISASGDANVTVDEINGTWTNVSSIEADTNAITLDPSDKQEVTVDGDADTLKFKSMAVDDATTDFIIGGAGGKTDLTIIGLPASSTISILNESTDKPLSVADTDASGTATFTNIEHSTATAELVTGDKSSAPTQSDEVPSDGTELSEAPDKLEVQVNDSDFGEDNITAQIFLEGSEIHREQLTANGTTSTTNFGSLAGGQKEWSVNLTDKYGNTNNKSYTFTVPDTIVIRNETEDHGKIPTASATLRFFEQNESDQLIVERTTSNGEIDMTGLPVNSQFNLVVSAPGYHNRTIIIDSIYEQETAFLLDKDISAHENRFVVSDRTGNFPPEDSELIVQRPINRSLYGGSPANYTWTNVAGDELGADEAFVTDLEQERRYRIVVRNKNGDQRVLGAYTPESTGTITLTVGSVVVDPEAPNTVGWSANRTNATGSPVRVNFEYNDTTDNTSKIWLHIYEYGNESNELLTNTSFAGTYGVFSNTQNVPSDENDTEWVVEFVAVRDGKENIRGSTIVNDREDVLPGMPDWLISVIFLGTVWGVAGIFSQRNGAFGGLVVAGMGAMFFFAGFVPAYLGGGVVALTLITAGILFVRERRGGGL